jgi:hypothetical protein
MKQIFGGLLVALLITYGQANERMALHFGLNWNYGTADFYTESQTLVSYEGVNLIHSRKNSIGLGFGVGLSVPVFSGLSIAAGYGKYYGSHHDAWQSLGEDSAEDSANDLFYMINAIDVDIHYKLVRLKNSWDIGLIGGLNYNLIQQDAALDLNPENYLGYKLGIGFYSKQLKHLGFQLLSLYKGTFLTPARNQISVQAGLSYML